MKFSTDRTSQQATGRTPQQTKGQDIMNTNATRTSTVKSTVERAKRGLKNIAAALLIVAAALGFSMTLVPNTSLLHAGLFHRPSDPCKYEKDALDDATNAKNKAELELRLAETDRNEKHADYLTQQGIYNTMYATVMSIIAATALASGTGCTVVWPIVGTIACAAAAGIITSIGGIGALLWQLWKTNRAKSKFDKAKKKVKKKAEKLEEAGEDLTEAQRDLSDCLARNRGWLGL